MALGDETVLALINRHQRDAACGVTLRKSFIMGTTTCGVCGGTKTAQPSGRLRCKDCRAAAYRAGHPVDVAEDELSPEDAAAEFVILLAEAGTQRAAAQSLGRSQAVVSERLSKARELLGDEVVIALLTAHQRDERCGRSLLKPFFLNSPICRQCGNARTPLATTGVLICRHCSNLRNQEYKRRHPGKIKASAQDYAARHADRIAQKSREYRAANPDYSRGYYQANAERIKANVKAYAKANETKLKAAAKLRRQEPASKERVRIAHAAWKKRNPHKVAEDNVRRAVAVWRQRPAWASKPDILEFYALARLRTALTGIPWVVDHIVPLNSDLVCGLHCEANLQVIPAVANVVKLNLWWPDMPDATPDCVTFAERPSLYLVPPAGPAPLLRASSPRPPALVSPLVALAA